MYLITLNKKNIALAISEAVRVLKPKTHTLYEDSLLMQALKFKNFNEIDLGLIRTINKVIVMSDDINTLKLKLSKLKLKKYYKDSYKVECSNYKEDHDKIIKSISSIVFKSLETKNKNKAKIDVNNPKTLFKCIKIGNKNFFVIELWKNKDDIRDRENKELPEKMPTTLNPKIAKAMLNLTGLRKGKIIDPFCGAGGILIEAARRKFRTTGYDIDKRAIGKAKLNLLHLGIKNVILEKRDALTMDKKFSAVVTDLPFGKNSKVEMELKELYSAFLKKALKYTKIIVIGMPAEIPKSIIPLQWKIINFFDIYIHKSMTKRIYLLKKNKIN